MCGVDVTAVSVCGYGASSCTGSVLLPTCVCNNAAWFIPSPDARSCVAGIVRFCGKDEAMKMRLIW